MIRFDETAVRLADGDEAMLGDTPAADVVVLVGRPSPQLVIGVDIQLERDEDKKLTWPLATMGLRARHRCDAVMLVVCPDRTVAEWAQGRIELGGRESWAPLVLGPDQLPYADESAPYQMQVLSAIAHARDPGAKGHVVALAERLLALDPIRAPEHYDIIVSMLPNSEQEEIKDMALSEKYPAQSELGKHFYSRGVRDGERRGLLNILEHKGLEVSDAHRDQLASASSEDLQHWIVRALDAKSADEVFEDP